MMIKELIKAAKEKNWDFVDSKIPKISNSPKFVEWAENKGLNHKNENIRDLAVSLLEKTSTLDEKTQEKLYALMSKDSNPYVRFRSAFALTRHEYTKHSQEIIDVLKQATQDPDIREIAEGYLKG